MWPLGETVKETLEEVANSTNITDEVLDAASCEEEDPGPGYKQYIEWAFETLQILWFYCLTYLRILASVVAQYAEEARKKLVEFAVETWRSIDFEDLRSRLDAWLLWLRLKLHEVYLRIHEFMLLRYDIWIRHSSTLWLHQKTGRQPETIVALLAGFLFLALSGVFYKFVWKRRSKRRRRTERSLSLQFGGVQQSTRGARDRGFSLDLSASTQSQPSSRTRGFSFDFFRRSNQPDPSPTNRDHLNSFDLFNAQDPGLAVDLNNPNHAIGDGGTETARPTTAMIMPYVTYCGPMETTLIYSTWTPPPTWTEASRSLMPTDTRINLQREISLELSKDQCMMSIREPSSSQTPLMLAVSQCSIHVKTPVIGGVLEIYVKDSSKEEWMEHTFDTAKHAAQFQLDMLAIQLFGPALNRMYQSLELIHQGSMACEGREYVCHDDTMSDEKAQGVGVAWDDVMRALGSNVPSLRVALERLWWHHYSMNILKVRARKRAKKKQKNGSYLASSNSSVGSSPTEAEKEGATGDGATGTSSDANKNEAHTKNQNEYIYMTTEYIRRRLLLGPVDFFRLFVPYAPDTALPNNESSRKRMVQLLRWRKRTATAAILVQAYVKARIVVNKGWVLSRPLPTHYLTRRLAFDDNIDNSQRDASAKNEYYEATVSRDVLTFVRPNEPDAFKPKEHWWDNFRPKKLRSSISKYQAFTLVGTHVFKIPQDDAFPLHATNDPVLTFGSLRALVEAHSDLDFLVMSFFPEYSKVGYINVFVRSLPKGVDSAFDRNMSRFKHGSKEIRDKKLSMMMQLGSSEIKTFYEVAAIAGVTYLMRSVAGDLDASTPNSDMGPSDRTPFPLIPIRRFGETYHFGGALQTDRKLPQNYCAASVHMDSTTTRFRLFTRLLMSLMERGFMSRNVYDVTFVLAANEQDELPERAMASSRMTRVEAKDIALPSIFVYGSSRQDYRRRSTFDVNQFKSILGDISMGGPRVRTMGGYESEDYDDAQQQLSMRSSTASESQRKRHRAEKLLESSKASVVFTFDPIEKAVNELVEILGDVKVPVRRDALPLYDFSAAVPMSLLEACSTEDGTLHDKELIIMSLLLLIKRSEIQRHYIAAGCNLKKAAIRIVETAAWRGQTFPIDQRICRIELQSGQFFQQGTDLAGRPVFYFRNMGLGPWRKNNDASVAAVLHRLEGALWELSQHDDNVKCTLIVIMGKPYKKYLKTKGVIDGASTAGEEDDEDDLGGSMASASFKDCNEDSPDGLRVANPRVNPDESWQVQTSKGLARQLITLISAHYPERLYQALVVTKPSQTISLRKLLGSYRLASFVESPVTRSKVTFLDTFRGLQKYVPKEELVTIAGGERPVDPEVFGLAD